MKKLWIPLVVMFSAASGLAASQNPFDLNKNMEQIDHEQERVLDDLLRLTREYGVDAKRQGGKKSSASPVKAPYAEETPTTERPPKSAAEDPGRVDGIHKQAMTQKAARAVTSAKSEETSNAVKEKVPKKKNLEKKTSNKKGAKRAEGVDSTALVEDEKKAAEEALRKAIMEVEAAGH